MPTKSVRQATLRNLPRRNPEQNTQQTAISAPTMKNGQNSLLVTMKGPVEGDVPVLMIKYTVKNRVLVLLYPTSFRSADCRIAHDDGGDVHVNVAVHVGRGRVNVISGLESVTLIFVGLVMLLMFWIL